MKKYFLIITLFLFACSDSSDDSSDINDPNNGSDGQLINLFFSEYAEGSSNNKYVEIYNPSSSSVNLSNYQIKGTNNGTAWGDNGERELALTGTLAANSVYIIAADAADQVILDKANLALPYESPVHYNGNDAVAIFVKDTFYYEGDLHYFFKDPHADIVSEYTEKDRLFFEAERNAKNSV